MNVIKRLKWPTSYPLLDVNTGVYQHLRHSYPIESIQIRNRQPIHNLHLPPQLVQRHLRVLRTQLARLLVRHKHKVIPEQGMPLRHVILLRDFRIGLADVNGQGILDAEDGIGGFIGVAAEV